MKETLIDNSKKNYELNSGQGDTLEAITAGCLQRIANATELMASNYIKLQKDYNYMREQRDKYQNWYASEQRRRSALMGVITRLKNKFRNSQNAK